MNENSFRYLVDLYRKSHTKAIAGNLMSGVITCTPDSFNIIEECRAAAKERNGGYFNEIFAGHEELTEQDEIPAGCDSIRYEWRLSSSGEYGFYNDVNQLIEKHSGTLSKGNTASNYFIISEDYCSSDEKEPPESIVKLNSVCEAISLLSQLAQYHDEKTQSPFYRLIFAQTSDDEKVHTVLLETKIDKQCVYTPKIDLDILRGIASSEGRFDTHFHEKRGIFRSSLYSFVEKSPNHGQRFHHLLANWDDFLNLYTTNLDAYLSKFSFNKFSREIAEEEFKIAEQYSKVMGDITGKLLSLPVSLAAIIGIHTTDDILLSSVYVLGALIVAVVMAGSVCNQQRQLHCINNSKSLVFGALRDRLDTYPNAIKDALIGVITSLSKNERFLSGTLSFFRVVAWIPVIFSLIIFIVKFGDDENLAFVYILLGFIYVIAYFFKSVLSVSISDNNHHIL